MSWLSGTAARIGSDLIASIHNLYDSEQTVKNSSSVDNEQEASESWLYRQGRRLFNYLPDDSKVRKGVYYRDLLSELISRNMKITYKDSVLGIAWSLLTPLLQLLIFYILFQKMFSIKIPRYSLYTFSGLLSWTWFQSALIQSASVIKSNRDLVRQPGLPLTILPIVTMISTLIPFLVSVAFLIAAMLLGGNLPKVGIFALPLVVVIQFVSTLSLAYFVAAINVFFNDTQHILTVVMQLYFFLTPVFYDIGSVPEKYRIFFSLNPMVHLIGAYRSVLMQGEFPEWEPLLLITICSVVFVSFSVKFYNKMSYRFAEEV